MVGLGFVVTAEDDETKTKELDNGSNNSNSCNNNGVWNRVTPGSNSSFSENDSVETRTENRIELIIRNDENVGIATIEFIDFLGVGSA